jgi:hypothetical protein
MVAAVVGVFLLAYFDLRREQARALDDFTAEQSAIAGAFAATLQARIARVTDDLTSLAATSEPSALGRGLVERGALYRSAARFDASGRRLALAAASAVEIEATPELAAAEAEAVAAARRGGLAVSAPLVAGPPEARTSMRFFALRVGAETAVLLVECAGLFDYIERVERVRCLVLDEARRWLELGQADRAAPSWRPGEMQAPGDAVRLFARMGSAARGAVTLDRPSAAWFGLERRLAVAGFAPVTLARGRVWSVAVVASAMRVRDRARVGAWRLGAATGLAALIVALFGVSAWRRERRALALAEALRLAEATGALRERSEKIVEAIPIGVLTLDGDRRVVSVNAYLVERGVRVGPSIASALPGASPDDVALLEELVTHACAGRTLVERAGLRIRLGDDGLRDVDAYAVPLGQPDTDCFVVLHDRTETRTLERTRCARRSWPPSARSLPGWPTRWARRSASSPAAPSRCWRARPRAPPASRSARGCRRS